MISSVYLKPFRIHHQHMGSEYVQLKAYKSIRADHPFDLRREDICIYYRESLAVEVIYTLFLTECILCEIILDNKKEYLAVVYRSPNQNNNEFDKFLTICEVKLNQASSANPFFTDVLNEFNAASSA